MTNERESLLIKGVAVGNLKSYIITKLQSSGIKLIFFLLIFITLQFLVTVGLKVINVMHIRRLPTLLDLGHQSHQ